MHTKCNSVNFKKERYEVGGEILLGLEEKSEEKNGDGFDQNVLQNL